VAVIVGAAGGIGREVTRVLTHAGAKAALVDLDVAGLEQTAGDLGLSGYPEGSHQGGPLLCPADISDRVQVDRAAAMVDRHFGRADVLINGAGINTPSRTFADLEPDDWDRVIAVNLGGVFHMTQALLPAMRRTGGVVVTIVSTAALSASPGAGTHYCAAKRALLSLAESINKEEGPHGIRACAILPGEVDTPLVDRRPQPPTPDHRAAMLRPVDVAEAVLFAVTRPPHVAVSEIVIWPTSQIAGRYRI
jgi:NAD(P)-dependent dehydrogenase (short-subunit alcohol dehydrogenase family)